MIVDGLERPRVDELGVSLPPGSSLGPSPSPSVGPALGPSLGLSPGSAPPLQRLASDRIGIARARVAPTQRRIRRRRRFVGAAKLLLPFCGLALLASIAVWPELERVRDSAAVALRRGLAVDPESGQMQSPRYRGVDERGRPYTVSAKMAREVSPGRIALTLPKGDLVPENAAWLMVEAERGVFLQHTSQLDLSGEVVLYRNDGTTLRTDAAAVELKSGAGASSEKTHAEGPFGVLDAQGFTLVDKGASIQFTGPAHLVLNSQK